jgi:hypothetical protein
MMAEQKKTPARTRAAASAKAPASQGATAAKRRTAKAATAKTSDVKSMAVKNIETRASEPKPELAAANHVEPVKPGTGKASEAAAVLIETVEAVKAAAVRAAENVPAKPPARSVAAAGSALATADEMTAPAARLLEAGGEHARQAYARAQATTEQMRHAMTETAAASTRGALEVNGKVLDAVRAQSDATFELWRSTLTAGSFAEAVRAQASGARQLYETTATHWRDVAETTTRWLGSAVKPIQSAWIDRGR